MEKANYEQMEKELKEVLYQKNYLMGNLANASAIINKYLDDVSWVGFYLLHKDELFLGPFQGGRAKTRVILFNELMGKAMRTYKTEVKNSGAICPSKEDCKNNAQSEIAIPIFYNREPVGVLDTVSMSEGRFSEKDVEALQRMAFLVQNVWRHMY